MGWLIAVAVIGGIASALIGSGAQSETNATNRRIASDTNAANAEQARLNREHNKEMYEMQVQDNIEMWHMQNEYNSPENQVARARDAGINPSFAVGGQSTAGAISSGVVNSSAPAQMQGYEYGSPLLGALSGMQTMLPLLSSLFTTGSMFDKTNAETKAIESTLPLTLKGMQFDNARNEKFNEFYEDFLKENLSSLKFDNNFKRKTESLDYDAKVLANDMLSAKIRLTQLSSEHQEVINKYVEPQMQLQFMTDCQNLALLYQQEVINEKQLDEIESRICANYASANASNASANLSNTQAALNNQQYQFNEETKDIRIDTLKAGRDKAQGDADIAKDNAKVLKNTMVGVIRQINTSNALQKFKNMNDYIIEGNRRSRIDDPVLGGLYRHAIPFLNEIK